ncbi:hypothetical protein [Arthrobacter ginkgonis]|uniref:hypothetical protein n=1 Tax=Arthrobacter ginkgonis TaxID=1630594 RepID=UPI0031EA7D96
MLVSALLEIAPELLDETRAYNNWQIGLRGDAMAGTLGSVLQDVRDALHADPARFLPHIDARALKALKFSELLPVDLAISTIAERTGDPQGASTTLIRPISSVR